MPRLMAWLLLTVALAGPMLTHAEAAEDLAHLLKLEGYWGEIEHPDGGVGDDPNVASVWRAGPTFDACQFVIPSWDSLVIVASLEALPRLDPNMRGRHGCQAAWSLARAPTRAAWLQVFLI